MDSFHIEHLWIVLVITSTDDKRVLILVIHRTGPHAKAERARKMTSPASQPAPTPIGEWFRQGTRFRADEIRMARCEVNYY